jgi:CBS domain-containing protein
VIEGCIWDLEARRAAKATSSRPAAKDGPQVSDYMSENVRSIHLDATLKEAGKLLQKYKIGLLFVDDDKRYVGVITESGLSRNAVARGLDPTTTLVKSCMARKIISIEDDEPIIEAVKLMKEHAIRHLAVTKDNTVIGIISVSDILRGYSGVE